MNRFQMFLPLTKVDAETRQVWGTFTAEAPDRASEVMDYDSSKPLFEAWSQSVQKSSGGKSLGNVRAQHDPQTAVGKVVELNFDDAQKAITGCVKVVDDAAWEKVQEGVFTGFSIGGSYKKRWNDPSNPALKRYTAAPSEVSIVDMPCLEGATFELIKTMGAEPVLMKFAKTAAKEAVPVPFWVEPDLEQGWRARDGQFFAKKDDARKHNEALDEADFRKKASTAIDTIREGALAAIADLAKAVAAKDGGELPEGLPIAKSGEDEGEGPTILLAKGSFKKAAEGEERLSKGLWQVGTASRILIDLKWLQSDLEWESTIEQDGSMLPNMLETLISSMAMFLRQLVAEETEELLTGVDVEVIDADLAAAAKITDLGKRLEALKDAKLPEGAMEKLEALGKSLGAGVHGLLKTLSGSTETDPKLLVILGELAKKRDPALDRHLQKAHNHVSKMVNGMTCNKAMDPNGDKSEHFKHAMTAHDALCAMGASCGGEDDDDGDEGEGMGKGLNKSHTHSHSSGETEGLVELRKQLQGLTEERDTLAKTLGEVTSLTKTLSERVTKLEAQPLPAKGARLSLDKTQDSGGSGSGSQTPAVNTVDGLAKALETSGLSQEDISKALMKAALRKGVVISG
jgi:hypothetical protein